MQRNVLDVPSPCLALLSLACHLRIFWPSWSKCIAGIELPYSASALPQTQVLPAVNAASQAPPHAVLWGAQCRCHRRLPLLTAENARRRQLPIAWLIHRSPELRHFRLCSVSVVHQLLCIWLSRLSSFLQSPVPCLPSPLHVPLSSEMPPAVQSFLSP